MDIKMLKIVFIFIMIFASSVMAQENVNDALVNVESRIDKFEEELKSFTLQMEESNHNSKIENNRVSGLIKEMDLSVRDLKAEVSQYKSRIDELEKSNANFQNQIQLLNNDISKIEVFMKTIPTKEPLSLVDGKRESVKVDDKSVKSEGLLINEDIKKEVLSELGLQSAPKTDDESKKDLMDASYTQAKKKYKDKNFTDAAIEFGDIIKKYPEGEYFHSSLVYLGLSMKELGKVNNACQAFANVINSKESIDEKVMAKAKEEFEKVNCKNLNKKDGK